MPETATLWSTPLDQSDPTDISHDREYDLLDRVIELVAQSGTFSRPALAAALQLSDRRAERLTVELELLGIIAAGEDDAPREVLIHPFQLSTFFTNFRARRRAANRAA